MPLRAGSQDVAVALLAVVLAACGGASAPQPTAAKPEQARQPARVQASPEADAALDAQVEGDFIWLRGAPLEDASLSVALERAGSTAKVLDVRLSRDFSEAALSSLLAAATHAGFVQVRLQHAGETLVVAPRDGASKARVIAWLHEGELLAYDLEEADSAKGLLGPFQLTHAAALEELERQLSSACRGQPCKAELDLLPGNVAGGMWQALRGWQQAAQGLPTFSFQVSAVAIAPSPPDGAERRVRYANIGVSGRLPPVVIQRIVRKNFAKLRGCYEAGLARSPELTGRVTVRFVIGRDGKVSNVADGGSEMADSEVQSCVLRTFGTLEFPPPSNGLVTVVYPVVFAPG